MAHLPMKEAEEWVSGVHCFAEGVVWTLRLDVMHLHMKHHEATWGQQDTSKYAEDLTAKGHVAPCQHFF